MRSCYRKYFENAHGAPRVAEKPSVRSALPYGPFTAQIRRFLQQFATLTLEAEAAIVTEYGVAITLPEYQAAERVLGAAIARSGRESERDALGGPLLQLVQGHRPSPDTGPSVASEDPGAIATSLRPIAEPALAALLAILMQDVLSAERSTQLYAPFERAIPRASLQQ